MNEEDLQGYRVLVVEDEPLIAMVIEDTLATLGCAIVGPFTELSEALRIAHEPSCDCAILDVNVCGGHITPVADTLLDKGIPILLASGYDTSALPPHLSNLSRLDKPYTSSQLKDGICALCARVNELRSGSAS